MAETYRCVVLARFVDGLVGPDDFAIEIRPVPKPGDGEILVRIIYASLDPGGRARVSGRVFYTPPLTLGDVAGAFNIGQMVTSNNEAYATGDLVVCSFGWTVMGLSKGGGYFAKIQAPDLPLSTWIGVLGVPGLTAYFGLKRVAGIKAGETLVVTSATGQVGDCNLAPEDVHGIKNTRVFITHRVRMEGLVVFDDLAQFPAAQAEMAAWIKAGKLLHREKVYDGVEQAPQAFRDMFEGTYFGRHLVRLAPEP